ncbi:MAG: hypothetical protein MMC33_001787 [Icmadophila ericetorum]|nr:hypothetical protein [Icmadophila ericetorum]
MISDSQLYTLAIFLGSLAMLLIVLYHWLEVNSKDDPLHETTAEALLGGSGGINMGEKVKSAGENLKAGGEKVGESLGSGQGSGNVKGKKGGR